MKVRFPMPLVAVPVVEQTIRLGDLRLESEANKRDRWAAIKRTQYVKERVGAALSMCSIPRQGQRCIVTITRIAPRSLDNDNLSGACKATIDSVATWIAPKLDRLGRMSGDDSATSPIRFRVEQRKGKPREYAVEIRIEPRTHECVCGECGRKL